ncbi:hypothetical protein [Marinithermus hydrothermalis]|uniref:hypothetical protein n=1 Tax=Marinithermus hydrothermalis TaxID=186192 RepID=UPI00030A318D|nr:hypothetical protein [Marinithermus hydrothermalis]
MDGQLEPGLHGPLWGAFMIEALEELRGPGRILHDRYPLRLAPDRTLVLAKDLGLEAEGRPVEMRYNGPVFVSGERAFALVG